MIDQSLAMGASAPQIAPPGGPPPPTPLPDPVPPKPLRDPPSQSPPPPPWPTVSVCMGGGGVVGVQTRGFTSPVLNLLTSALHNQILQRRSWAVCH